MQRRDFLRGLAHLPILGLVKPSGALASSVGFDAKPKSFRLFFGSCCSQDRAQTIWKTIEGQKPDIFVLLGDNIYADTEDMDLMREKYAQLEASKPFANFRKKVPIVGIWDDHDYGVNDGGAEYPFKNESKGHLLNFLREPAGSERWHREGAYTSYLWGEEPHRVQLILMDLRWFRSPLIRTQRGYIPNPDPNATILGEAQWAWLEEQFAQPADFRIIASSNQFVSPIHQWEKWGNFPFEKARFHRLIDKYKLENFVIISGDMHYAELSQETTLGGISVVDLTSSGLTHFEPSTGIPNPNRVSVFDRDLNFGSVTINWDSAAAVLEVRDSQANPVIEHRLTLTQRE